MKAFRITGKGGPEVLRLVDVADPVEGPTEIRVRVKATALNRADILQCRGLYPAPPDAPADIPGLEYAGEVIAVGSRVQRYRVGDRVMGIIAGGAFAEQLVTHERTAVPVPTSLDDAHAAAIPEAFFTAFDALVLQAQLRSGEHVLIHAAGSGVGTAASQITAALSATSIGTLRSASKAEKCRQFGLTHAIVTAGDPPSFARQVLEKTAGRGADVILDLVGARYAEQTLEAAASRSRWMSVGLVAGSAASIDLGVLMRKRMTITGTVLRSRPLEQKIEVAQAFEKQLLPLFARGQLKPVVDRVLPATRIEDAFAAMSSNENVGKIVLSWS